jgi:septal ring factor EnvC (AmiA/AmiB activator)
VRNIARLFLAIPALFAANVSLAASAPVQVEAEPLELSARRALAEAKAAEAHVQRLQRAAEQATDEAARLRARQAAAAEAIGAAEARISAADANARVIAAQIAARRERLKREQAPAGSLLAALALMAERPPLLAIVDRGSTEEFVRVRLLLDSTLPAIRERTTALRAELQQGRQLQLASQLARAALIRSRNELASRRREFAALEQQALKAAELRGSEALGAGDIALARGEQASQLSSQAERSRAARSIAIELAHMPPPPPRPGAIDASGTTPSLAYSMPSDAPVVEGLGAIASNGVRSRGLTLGTGRGAAVYVPATGTIRFSGPFRGYDGIVIIDHGSGWMSLILNVASTLRPGERVQMGNPLGRALGHVGVELSRNGRHVSPALIAGSSQSLSKGRKES